MARTKKQTLENASERKRLIQEEILRESLAAKQKKAAGDGGGASSSSSPNNSTTTSSSRQSSGCTPTSTPARSRSKGKHRSRQVNQPPSGVASLPGGARDPWQGSSPPALTSAACSASPVLSSRGSASTRRKAETRRDMSKSSRSKSEKLPQSQLFPLPIAFEMKETAVASPSPNKGELPKAFVCLPDLYSGAARSSESDCYSSKDHKARGSEKTTQSVSHGGDSVTTPVSGRTSSTGKKLTSSSNDQKKQNTKKALKDNVQASLKSLRAASEMVREEKKRTSRQRSPGFSKEESPGSGNPSPERRSPRRQSPSSSSEVPQQQPSGERKKKAKQKIQEEKPKINIFTDNIGVELGKRIRSPRRLSDDMIALPIFSARRWSSLPREASYIAEKLDGETVSAKSSPDDNESFKSPHAVGAASSTRGVCSASSRKKNSPDDKTAKAANSTAEDGVEEDSTPKRKVHASKFRSRLPLSEASEGDCDTLSAEVYQNASVPSDLPSDSAAGNGKQKPSRETTKPSAQSDCDTLKAKGSRKGSDQKKACESLRNSLKESAHKDSLNKKTSSSVPLDNLDACDRTGGSSNSDCDLESRQPSDSSVSFGVKEVVEEKKSCDNDRSVKIELPGSGLKPKVKEIVSQQSEVRECELKQIQDQKHNLPNRDAEATGKADIPSPESTEMAFISTCEDGKRHDENPQKSLSKKSKGKSLTKSSSGEKKRKREKMDEVLSSICRDMMSGVVITPSNPQANLSKAEKLYSERIDESTTGSEGSHQSTLSGVSITDTPGVFSQSTASVGSLPHREAASLPGLGLLQPARNIFLSAPSGGVSPVKSLVASNSIPTVTSSAPLPALSSSSSMHTVTPCTLQTSVPLSGSVSPAKILFGNSPLNTAGNACGVKKVGNSPLNTAGNACGVKKVGDCPTTAFVCNVSSAASVSVQRSQAVSQSQSIHKSSPNPAPATHLGGQHSVGLLSEDATETSRCLELDTNDSLSSKQKLSSPCTSASPKRTTKDHPAHCLPSEAPDPVDSLVKQGQPIASVNSSPSSPSKLSLTTNVNQAVPCINDIKSSLVEPASASTSNLACVSSKEASPSSLLCAMLRGGSEVTDTYEKSKPGAVCPSPSSDDNSSHCKQQVRPPGRLATAAQQAEGTPAESCHKEESMETEDQSQIDQTSRPVTTDGSQSCDLISEKGDAPVSEELQVKPEIKVTNDEFVAHTDTRKCSKQRSGKDLKIDIASRLKKLNENVLKLLEIDVEEPFLGVKIEECKAVKSEIKAELETEIAATERECGDERNASVCVEPKFENEIKEIKAEPEEKAAETPLYGVISNLAARLKDQAWCTGVDLDELVGSCPKHMLKVCEEIDETTRMSSLRQRLKEEQFKEESKKTSDSNTDGSLLSCERRDIKLYAGPADGNISDVVSAEKEPEGGITDRPIPPPTEGRGDVSPHLTHSSSTNNSLCDLDPDAMTSAVKGAAMDISIGNASTENVGDPDVGAGKQPSKQDFSQKDHVEESPDKRLLHKSKTFDFPNDVPSKGKPGTLRRVNSSPQLRANSPLQGVSAPESSLESSRVKDLQVKSKLGGKIPVPGTSYASRAMRRSWRTPRVILQPKPLSVLTELEESSASEKSIFACPNLQKYLNVPSNRVIVPLHKRKEMQILDERAKRDEEQRAATMAERTDKERAEELINLEYLKFEPDFDEVEGLLIMSFSCEAELTAHVRVEKALEWDKDDTMLRIAQAKAFEEAKILNAGMEKVKFKHLRGQHMRWKKYRRLYSSEVKSILNGTPSSVEEQLKREAMSRSPKKTSDISKIKGWKTKTKSLGKQQHESKQQQKINRWRSVKKAGASIQISRETPPPTPLSKSYTSPPDLLHTSVLHCQDQKSPSCLKTSASFDMPGHEAADIKPEFDSVQSRYSKRRSGFSHQKEHRQLFRELNMDFEDRMIHRKLGGWSLKGNRPKAFSKAAHRREKKKMLLVESLPSDALPAADGMDAPPTDESRTPSQTSSATDITSPPKDELDPLRKRKTMKLFYPLLSERVVRNALEALVDLSGLHRCSKGRGGRGDDVDGSGGQCHHGTRKLRDGRQFDSLPALRPIKPHPPASITISPVVLINTATLNPARLCASYGKDSETQDSLSCLSVTATAGSPALSDLSKSDTGAAPSVSLLAANAILSVPSSPTPPPSLLSSAANTPSTLAPADAKEEAVMEGVDTAADIVSSPSIADSASSKSCGKPGCRYGCICHLCSVSEGPPAPTSPAAKSPASCDKEYCRLGCICDSLDPEKPIPGPTHCGKPACILSCLCLSKAAGVRGEGGGGGDIGTVYPGSERRNGKKAKRKRTKTKDINDTPGRDLDDIPYLPYMKRRPKPGERFSNLPQRQKTHRSAKNLDAITRKALMLYETSEIYCEKTERPPRRDQKEVPLGLSGNPLDEDFSFSANTLATPVIEIDSAPEEAAMLYEEEDFTPAGLQPYSVMDGTLPDVKPRASYGPEDRAALPEDSEPLCIIAGTTSQGFSYTGEKTDEGFCRLNRQTSEGFFHVTQRPDDGTSGIPSASERVSPSVEDERPTVTVAEQSAHKRKRKSHPLSGEIFTLSTCARMQPYRRKSWKPAVPHVTENSTNPAQNSSQGGSAMASGFSEVSMNSNSSTSATAVFSSAPACTSSAVLPSSETALPAGPPIPTVGSSTQQVAGHPPTLMPGSRSVAGGSGGEARARKRYQQPWHISMVCLKARGPLLRKESTASQPIPVGDEEEEDVQEEDEVKLLEFAANCNWEGARKEILSKVAQCLTRGQYPQPRTMNICEFVLEILPKAHKPSVIPEELRKKLPGKMYSVRVRITRREILSQPQTDLDTQVIDLSEGSPMKSPPASGLNIPNPKASANLGISGLSRLRVSPNFASKPGMGSGNQQRSSSAPSSRRASTDVSSAVTLTVPSVTFQSASPSLAQVRVKGTSLQASLNNTSESLQTSCENHSKAPLSVKGMSSAASLSSSSPSLSSGASAGRSLLSQKSSPVIKPIVTSGSHKPLSLLTTSNTSHSSNSLPTSGIMPLIYSLNGKDVKYMKIHGKDMKVVGVDKNSKILTVPFPLNQKLGGSEAPKEGAVKAGAVPFMAVPVCSPGGPTIFPLIPTSLAPHIKHGGISPALTSGSLPTSPHQILLRLPANSPALVKGSVLLHSMGRHQTASGALQPLLLPKSPKSLLSVASVASLMTTSNARLSHPQQKTSSASTKPKAQMTSNDEMILAFDAAHVNKQQGLKKSAVGSVADSTPALTTQDQSVSSPTTLVTSSLQKPIMSSEESPSMLKAGSSDVQHLSNQSDASAKSGKEEDGTKAKLLSDKNSEPTEEVEETVVKNKADPDVLSKHGKLVKPETNKKPGKGPNKYVPTMKKENSTLQLQIMVYPPASALNQTSPSALQPDSASSPSAVEIATVPGHGTVTTEDASKPTALQPRVSPTPRDVSRDTSASFLQPCSTLPAEDTQGAAESSLSSSLHSSTPPPQQQAASTTAAAINSLFITTTTSSPPLSSSPATHATATSSASVPPEGATVSPLSQQAKQGVKRKRPAPSEAETADSGSKRPHVSLPESQRRLPPLEEEQDSNSSSNILAMMGQSAASPLPALSASQPDRPISAMSTSLSTTSGDNLLIMLSSDESEIDVGEADDPQKIMAIRDSAERAFENDHGYQRTVSSGSTSPVSSEGQGNKSRKPFDLKSRSKPKLGQAEHNKRERERRSALRNLLVDLHRAVCSATGTKFSQKLSGARILQEARAVIQGLRQKEVLYQQELWRELKRKDVLLRQRSALREVLSKTMSQDQILAISNQALKQCRKILAAQALAAHLKTTSDSSSDPMTSASCSVLQGLDAVDGEEDNSRGSPCPQEDQTQVEGVSLLNSLLSTKPALDDEQGNVQFVGGYASGSKVASQVDASNTASISESPCLTPGIGGEDLTEAAGPLPQDTVDLISQSSSGEGDHGSLDADQGSVSPARYEDISDPEDTPTVKSEPGEEEPVQPPEVAATLSVPQAHPGYEDISDVEEAKPPNYEDISDPEETLVVS